MIDATHIDFLIYPFGSINIVEMPRLDFTACFQSYIPHLIIWNMFQCEINIQFYESGVCKFSIFLKFKYFTYLYFSTYIVLNDFKFRNYLRFPYTTDIVYDESLKILKI